MKKFKYKQKMKRKGKKEGGVKRESERARKLINKKAGVGREINQKKTKKE